MKRSIALAAVMLMLTSVGRAIAGSPPEFVGRAAPAMQGAPASVLDGAYTDAQASRGEIVYLGNCVNCHGPNLDGGDMTPALVGAVFGSNWNDLTLGDLFERIRISMPLDAPGKLSRQQNADVIAFILKSNKWPVGQSEVPREAAALRQVKIQSVR